MKKISLIIPCYNESGNIDKLHEALLPLLSNKMTPRQYDWEVLLVNDGSRDDTLDRIVALHRRDPRVSYVSLSRNFGKENAMLAGFDYATGDCAVILDADLQHPVDAIPAMIEKWEEGFDDVYGRRNSRGRESWLRSRLSMTFYSLLSRSSRIDVLPNVGDFRLLDRRCLAQLRRLRETQRYTKGLYCWVGFRKTSVPFDTNERTEGTSSFSLLRLFNLAVEGITSYTTAPLRLATVMGLIVALASMLFLIYVIVKTCFYGDPVAGFPTLICVILFLGGVQLISLGIIGEYVARIFLETKGRPAYIADRHNDRKVD